MCIRDSPPPLQVLGHGVGRLAKAELWKVLEEKKIGLYETNSMGKDLSPTPSSPVRDGRG